MQFLLTAAACPTLLPPLHLCQLCLLPLTKCDSPPDDSQHRCCIAWQVLTARVRSMCAAAQRMKEGHTVYELRVRDRCSSRGEQRTGRAAVQTKARAQSTPQRMLHIHGRSFRLKPQAAPGAHQPASQAPSAASWAGPAAAAPQQTGTTQPKGSGYRSCCRPVS